MKGNVKQTPVDWLKNELTEKDYNLAKKTFLQIDESLEGIFLKNIFKEANNMRTICLEVKDDIFKKVLDFLRLLPKDSFRVRVDEADDIFTAEDEKVYKKSIRELRNGEAISLEQAKRELLGV